MAKKEITYTNSQIEALIDDLIHSDRNRKILKARFIDGEKISDLGERFNLSDERIKKILKKDGDYVLLHLNP